MGHIAYLSNNRYNKISFMEQYTKYLVDVVEYILYKKIFKGCIPKHMKAAPFIQ